MSKLSVPHTNPGLLTAEMLYCASPLQCPIQRKKQAPGAQCVEAPAVRTERSVPFATATVRFPLNHARKSSGCSGQQCDQPAPLVSHLFYISGPKIRRPCLTCPLFVCSLAPGPITSTGCAMGMSNSVQMKAHGVPWTIQTCSFISASRRRFLNGCENII